MGADAEGEVRTGCAVDVEFVAVRPELAVVAVGGADQHHHHAALGHGLAVERDVAGHIARHVRRGRLEAQQFLDRLRDQRPVLDQLAALIGVFGENLSRPTDQPGGRLVAGAGDHVEVDQQLVAGQPAGGAGLVDELDVEQLGHDVVGRMCRRASRCRRRRSRRLTRPCSAAFMGLPASVRSLRVAVVADEFLVVLGDAEQHADDLHRHLRAQVGDEVELARADQRIQALSAEVADLSARARRSCAG